MENEIKNSIEQLNKGGLLLYPTDTIWGIGCNVNNENAVRSIFKLKQRLWDKKLIVLVSDIEMLETYVGKLDDALKQTMAEHKNPLTVIYQNAKLPNYLMGPDQSIAIRIPKHTFCKALIKRFGSPITSTSANLSNDPIPKVYEEINKRILKGVDYVVNLERSKPTVTKASDIARYSERKLHYIRKD